MEAPSPAPILIAEPIEENKFIIDNTDTSINITLQNNNDRFNKVININDEFWEKNKKFYQDSFELFTKTIKNTLIEKIGDLTFDIIKLFMDEENINVKLKYSSMFFGFTTEIILVKILSENEELVNQVKELQKQSLTTGLILEKILKENNDLKSQVRYLSEQITIIKEEIGLGKLKKQLDSKKKLKLIKVSNVNELITLDSDYNNTIASKIAIRKKAEIFASLCETCDQLKEKDETFLIISFCNSVDSNSIHQWTQNSKSIILHDDTCRFNYVKDQRRLIIDKTKKMEQREYINYINIEKLEGYYKLIYE